MFEDPEKSRVCRIVTCIIVPIVIIFPVALSIFIVILAAFDGIRGVRYDELGLQYNSYSGRVKGLQTEEAYVNLASAEKEDLVKRPGIHYRWGFGNRILIFPSYYQNIDFDEIHGNVLESRTYDALPVSLDVSFQYKLTSESIVDLFWTFGHEDYRELFALIARAVLRDVASEFNASHFFDRRTEIVNAMHFALNESLKKVHTQVSFFQLRRVDLPNSFEGILGEQEVTKQEKIAVEFVAKSLQVEAETEVSLARQEAESILRRGQGDAEAIRVLADYQAQGLLAMLTAEADAYEDLCVAVSFNETEFLSHLWMQMVKKHEAGKLTVLLDRPSGL